MILNFLRHRYREHYHEQHRHAKKLFAIDLFLLFLTLVVSGIILFLFFWQPPTQQWIDLEISFGKQRVRSGEPITISIDYINRSRYKITNAILGVQLPPDFAAIERDPNSKQEFSDNWLVRIPEILPRAHGQKQIQGILWAKPKTGIEITALMSYQPENTKERGQTINSFILIPAESVLQTRLSLAATTALPQSQIAYSYALKNTGASLVKATISTNWDADAEISANPFVNLAPGAEKIYNGLLRVPSVAQVAQFLVQTGVIINERLIPQSADSAAIKIIRPAKSAGATTEKKSVNSVPIDNLAPSLSAQTRYYTDEGDKLGHGPLPPQSNTTTKYWIFIEIKNLPTAARGANFSATLAPGVKFTGKQSITIGAPLAYNNKTGAIIWQHTTLPTDSRLGLYFEVAVKPTPEQIDDPIMILKDLKFEATDSATGEKFYLTAPNLTSRLPPSDPGAIGN